MSFLMFHSGNIPIIEEDDMKLVELVIKKLPLVLPLTLCTAILMG